MLNMPLNIRILASVIHAVAISCTVVRLVHRLRIFSLWWEDLYAAISLIFDVVCLVCVWIVNPGINIAADYLTTTAFTSVIWAARLSILLAAVRVTNPIRKTRLACQGIGLCFWIMWIVLLVQKYIICHHNGCVMGNSVAISQLITDSVSDIALVILPIWLLRNVKLCSKRRAMILSAFTASLSITIVTIAHSIILFGSPSYVAVIVAHLKTALSLVVCNLLIIVSFIYRLCGWNTCNDRTTFTTVDLSQLCSDPDCNLNTTGTRSFAVSRA